LFFRAIIAFVIIGYMQYSFFLIYNEGLTKQNTSPNNKSPQLPGRREQACEHLDTGTNTRRVNAL